MTVKWEKTEKNVGVLEIEVEEDKVSSALDQAFKKVVQRINVPGFRKGKVPRKIFEARFGIESLYQDALDILLPQAYSRAVIDTSIQPVDRPDIDVVQMEVGKPLVFKATVTIKPEVELAEYKGITYEDKDFSVTDEAVDAELERIRTSHAEFHVAEETTVQTADLVVIDFKGFVDGEEFEGGEAENYQLEVGSGTFIPGFEEQLIDMVPGEDKEIVVTFPENYHVKTLAGREAHFQVHLHDIKRRVLPELNDDFAKDISEFDTFDEFKADVRHNLEHRAEHEHEHFVEDAVVTKVVEAATVEIPAVMIEAEIDRQMQGFTSRLEQQGIPLDAYQEFTGATTEELRDQFRKEAERSVRTSLVLEAIAQREGVEVSDEELDLELQKIADSARMDFAQVKTLLGSRDPGMSDMRDEIKIRKAVQLLVEDSVKA